MLEKSVLSSLKASKQIYMSIILQENSFPEENHTRCCPRMVSLLVKKGMGQKFKKI